LTNRPLPNQGANHVTRRVWSLDWRSPEPDTTLELHWQAKRLKEWMAEDEPTLP